MKQIPLTQGKVATVDDADFDFLSQYKWHAKKGRTCFYACTGHREIKMHRLIMGMTDPSIFVDHINHDGLDNRRHNLRVCTIQENGWNSRSARGSSSKYLGVSKRNKTVKGKTYSYWVAQIQHDGKNRTLGSFPFTPEGELQAATVYDNAAKQIRGEFANLNTNFWGAELTPIMNP